MQFSTTTITLVAFAAFGNMANAACQVYAYSNADCSGDSSNYDSTTSGCHNINGGESIKALEWVGGCSSQGGVTSVWASNKCDGKRVIYPISQYGNGQCTPLNTGSDVSSYGFQASA